MTWNAFHRRGETLQHVIDTLDARRDGELPMDLPGVAETFRDELDLISALQLKWHARLSGNIERALIDQPLDLEAAVAEAWQRTNEELPGVRLVIDRYTEAPLDAAMAQALSRAADKERLKLAAAAGLCSDESPRAVEAGRRVEQRARTTEVPAQRGPSDTETLDEATPPSLVERIRAVLVA
jgi:hypothetical protein